MNKGIIKEPVSVEQFRKYIQEYIVNFAYSNCDNKNLTLNIKYDFDDKNKTYKDFKRILLGKTTQFLNYDIENILNLIPKFSKIYWLSLYWSDSKGQFKEQVFIKAM